MPTADVRLSLKGPVIAAAGVAKAVLPFGNNADYPPFSFRLFPGTGNNQASYVYYNTFSVAAAGSYSLNLRGGAVNDVMGAAVNWTKLKFCGVFLDIPDGTDPVVQFGPQNVSNAAALWFADVTANYKMAVRNSLIQYAPVAGWTLADGAGTLAITNAGGSTVTGTLLLAGV